MNGILNDEYSHSLANWINNYQSAQHYEQLNLIQSEIEMVYVKTYNLIPFKDGDNWCVLLGTNIQEGIAGFGDTPLRAIRDFNKHFTSNCM
jgi:hypothetical protein